MICNCTNPDPSTCAACRLDLYRARDSHIAIGLPVKQDDGEYAYPGYVNGQLTGYYPNLRAARLALDLDLDAMGAASAPIDVEFAPVGFLV